MVVVSTLLQQAPSPVAPSREDLLFDAWRYACGVTDNGRRKLTNQDVDEQPSREECMWDNYPLTRLANWYARDGGSDNEFVGKMRRERWLTPAQVRGVCNVMLGAWKRGWRAEWMVT